MKDKKDKIVEEEKDADLDIEEDDEELDRLLEKYANLEKQHEQWNRENHDLEKSQEIADKFAEEMGLKTLEISENEESKKRK